MERTMPVPSLAGPAPSPNRTKRLGQGQLLVVLVWKLQGDKGTGRKAIIKPRTGWYQSHRSLWFLPLVSNQSPGHPVCGGSCLYNLSIGMLRHKGHSSRLA